MTKIDENLSSILAYIIINYDWALILLYKAGTEANSFGWSVFKKIYISNKNIETEHTNLPRLFPAY